MFRKKVAGVAAAACAIAAVTAAIAIAQGTGTSSGPSTKSKGATARSAEANGSQGPPGAWIDGPGHHIDGPGRGAVHSVSVVPDKAGTGFVTLTSDRGTVKSVDSGAGSITVAEGTKSATYKTVALSVPADATIVRDGKKASLSEIKADDEVSVGSSSEGTTVFAMDSSFHPEHGFGRGGPPGMPGPPPGHEASGAETK
jgi:hypothetical protein